MAAATTIDFEELAGGTQAPFDSQGFTFTGYGNDQALANPAYIAGGTLNADAYADLFQFAEVRIDFSRTDGAAFALYSVDVTGIFTLGVSGVRASDGQSIFTNDFSELGSGDWLNVSSVTFFESVFADNAPISISGSVDNIVVGAAVPVPAAVWLFGSALGLLGWIRKRA